jgi:hypothetical protein
MFSDISLGKYQSVFSVFSSIFNIINLWAFVVNLVLKHFLMFFKYWWVDITVAVVIGWVGSCVCIILRILLNIKGPIIVLIWPIAKLMAGFWKSVTFFKSAFLLFNTV